MSNFVQAEELTYFVQSIRPFQLMDVGSDKWLDVHEKIIKLSQQAILEAAAHREEEVKEFLMLHDKLKILIHEAYCVFLWKTRVLPHLLEIDPNPEATFLIYTVFFHEGAVISLLDASLFHRTGCEALQDTAIDLIDYCAQGVAQLIGLTSMADQQGDSKLDVDEAVLAELERQKREIIYKIGLRCISILNYLADNVDALPLSATRRMTVTHDIPWLMADLLNFRPWQRHSKQGLQKFIDEKWILAQGELASKVVKYEAQTWFCLRQLLLNPVIMGSYELNDERRKHITRCQGLLHECVIDQLPPLLEFKLFLNRLSVCADSVAPNKKLNLVLEEVPQIREDLIKEAERAGGFLQIAQLQEGVFLSKEKDRIFYLAQRLNVAYNTDLLAEMEQNAAEDKPSGETIDKHCANCTKKAEKKCANCKTAFYCSKQCQLDDWPKHKKTCIAV